LPHRYSTCSLDIPPQEGGRDPYKLQLGRRMSAKRLRPTQDGVRLPAASACWKKGGRDSLRLHQQAWQVPQEVRLTGRSCDCTTLPAV
jgi:hypothetical protein